MHVFFAIIFHLVCCYVFVFVAVMRKSAEKIFFLSLLLPLPLSNVLFLFDNNRTNECGDSLIQPRGGLENISLKATVDNKWPSMIVIVGCVMFFFSFPFCLVWLAVLKFVCKLIRSEEFEKGNFSHRNPSRARWKSLLIKRSVVGFSIKWSIFSRASTLMKEDEI